MRQNVTAIEFYEKGPFRRFVSEENRDVFHFKSQILADVELKNQLLGCLKIAKRKESSRTRYS